MAQYQFPRTGRPPARRMLRITLIVVAVLVLIGARTIASTLIDYQWWKEMRQVETWLNLYFYGFGPLAAATLLAFAALWMTHARALKFAGTSLGEHPLYARLSTLALLILGFIVSSAAIETWTVVRYAGSRNLAAEAWHDPVFGRPDRKSTR